jgi:ABC-type antimicrobial peptide transport system permease subunit
MIGALKAIGTTNVRIIGMILLQALVVGVIGYALGMGLTASFFTVTERQEATRGTRVDCRQHLMALNTASLLYSSKRSVSCERWLLRRREQ